MGQYLSGTLIYGYALGEDEHIWESEDEDELDEGDWVCQVLHRRGIFDQTDWSTYPERDYGKSLLTDEWQTRRDAWGEANLTAQAVWTEAQRAVKEEFPYITVDFAGVGDYSIPVLGIKDSGFEAHGTITRIDRKHLYNSEGQGGQTSEPYWDLMLTQFAEAAGIDLTRKSWNDEPVFQGPDYWLALGYF